MAAKYAAWLCWLGLVTGGATFVGAIALLLRPSLFDGVIVYGPLASLALLRSVALGVVAWRRRAMTGASRATEDAAQ